MQFDPDHLSALAAILRRGSFEAAASELGVTPSAISQRIRTFEDRIGAALINRGSPCTATPIGARIARHAEDIGLLEARLARDLGFDTTADRPVAVRIAVNADSLATWFVPALAAVPEILFDLVIDDQDHSAEWLQRGEVSAAVTSATSPTRSFCPDGVDRSPAAIPPHWAACAISPPPAPASWPSGSRMASLRRPSRRPPA